MSSKVVLTHEQVRARVSQLADFCNTHRLLRMFPIPRGGIPVAYLMLAENRMFSIVNDPDEADMFLDDIVDSGETMKKWCDDYPDKPFLALVDKLDITDELKDSWVVFPWEVNEGGSIEDNIRRLLQFVGEDPNRGGLLETPDGLRRLGVIGPPGMARSPRTCSRFSKTVPTAATRW